MTHTHIALDWSEHADNACDSDVLQTNQFRVHGVLSREAQITGHCPYCYGSIEFTRKLKLLPANPSGTTGQSIGKKTMDITARCTCALDHPGRPAGERGCGRSWVATGHK
ncbi:hypothetical protein J2Y46_000968 [Microbacterium sp. BE35]|uniref:hypothetical protein n=1 Tax=Microbacterium sp. BE35 TaxID=2817773 RepID=UPI002856CA0B|nr:hypothetical protein [Microbacterium sp. BE35]MDR7188152.1 hypothetical protein [Microbacterium sp. BE35]